LLVDVKEIVGEAVALGQLELADRHPATGGQIDLVAALNDPPCPDEQCVDCFTRL